MDFDTALLRTFVAVADELHFGRAAAGLVVSQQAVSKRIARLEALLGAALLDRSRRGVALSPAGEQFLPSARLALETLDAAVAVARPEARPLRVDVIDEHLAMLRFVRELAAGRPDARIEATMRGDHLDAVSALRGRRCDIAFGRAGQVGSPWPDDIDVRLALLEPVCLLVGDNHPWAGRDGVGLRELRGVPLWFPATGSPAEWLDLLDELSSAFGLAVDRTGSTMGFDHFVGHVRGSGVPSLYGAAMPPPPTTSVRVVPVVDPVPVFAWSAIWPRRLPAQARSVLDGIVARARAATPEPHPDDAWMPASDRAALTRQLP